MNLLLKMFGTALKPIKESQNTLKNLINLSHQGSTFIIFFPI